MKPFLAGHEDLIHDIAYDFYGRRLATCSSDQHVKVFDRVGQNDGPNGGWELCDSWKAHDAAVVKVTWCGPEFGQVIASCSHDCTIRIFEEDAREQPHSGRRWKRRHVITDASGPLYDIAFAPSHMGLKLASIGADGTFRIHEAMDPNTLGYWATIAEIAILSSPPNRTLQSSFALAWCPSRFFKESIVVCVLDDAFIYQRDGMGKYVRAAQLPEHRGLIRDVAWAPSMGRGYQLIATACKDGFVRIFKVTGGSDDNEPLNVELLSKFDDHHGEVWRVSWNLTGTILSSAGDDGKIRFWKAAYSNEFQCIAVVSAEQRAQSDLE